MTEGKVRSSGERERAKPAAPALPAPATQAPAPKSSLPTAVYIAIWIGLSSSVIIFNKWVLDRKGFGFPITLTTWHMVFATATTQVMARCTNKLDSRKKVPMTGRVYLRAIVPIGVFFSMSLVFSNYTYLYLSVAFIQMLKATTPVATLLATWALGITPPSLKTLTNVTAIVVGVIIASMGELKFVFIGFVFSMLGVVCEATRLAMVERLLSGGEFKMDPVVSLYYYAPACAVMNGIAAIIVEGPKLSMDKVYDIGLFPLLMNAAVAFLLNVSVVMLIGKTSALVLTLSGVFKDILLVIASMVVFLDPVSPLQAFGYSIALGGLVYYKLGGEKLKGYIAEGQRSWREYGTRQPIMRKIIIFGLVCLSLFVILGGLAPHLNPEYDMLKRKGIFGEKGT